MKKIVSLILALCMMLSLFAVSASATEAIAASQMQTKDIITIMVNGVYVDCSKYGQLPVIVEGRTLVPLRSVFEALGATVEWNNDTRSVTSVKGDVTVVIAIDSNQMLVNDTVKALDVPAQIMNGRTMVPVRAVAEAFGCTVEWDGDTRTVIITTEAVAETPEETVLNMWAKFTAGDFAGIKEYVAEGVELEGITDMETMVSEELGMEMDMSQFTPEQAEKLEAATVKLVNTILAIMKLEVTGTTMVDENTAVVNVVLSVPNLELMDMDTLLDEDTATAIMLEVIAANGYTVEDLNYMSEAEQEALVIDFTIVVVEYLCDIIAENSSTLPAIEEPTELTLKLTDGKWLIIE